MSPVQIWQKAQDRIKEAIGASSYNTWFSSINIHEKPPNTLVIETPDEFFKNWIIEHFEKDVRIIIGELSPLDITIEYTVNPDVIGQNEALPIIEMVDESTPNNLRTVQINSLFTFENFVVGSSNRFASAAGMAVADSPAKAYNPLFIYGQVGLGKTHLLQAITNKMHRKFPHLKICYLTSETFTNDLIDAIRHRSTSQFRKKYRDIDVLLIDDIQFIAGKESTQEEFFHTFNFLHENHKQIIITSDRPPKEISNLEERLSSRFAWGLIADIQPPDFETRVAILKKKVEQAGSNIPDDVVIFIAEEIKTNIRELEGALIRVAAYAQMEDRLVTLERTKFVLKDMVRETAKTISIEMIQKIVANFYNVSVLELRAKRRNKNIVLARQLAMFLSRTHTNMSLPEIGSAFGGKDHTTVLHSCKKIDQMIKDDSDIRNTVEHLSTRLKQ